MISVGRGKSNDKGETFPLDVKAGDRVLFGKYAGTEIKIDGEDFLIMREEEVLGILEGASEGEGTRSEEVAASFEPRLGAKQEFRCSHPLQNQR